MKTLYESSSTTTPSTPLHPAQGLATRFGVHPAIALFTLCIDLMSFGGEVGSFGLFLPFSALMASAVGYVTYHGQQSWYGDSAESAKTKAVMLAVLTFIPSPLPSVLYAPLGIVGFFRRKG